MYVLIRHINYKVDYSINDNFRNVGLTRFTPEQLGISKLSVNMVYD